MCRSRASSDWARSGSHTTTSASEPGRRQPLRGNSPNVRAGSLGAQPHPVGDRDPGRPHTPARPGLLVSMPGSPPGISVKSANPLGPRPAPRRLSSVQKGQWSVARSAPSRGPGPPTAPRGARVARRRRAHEVLAGPPAAWRRGAGTGAGQRRGRPALAAPHLGRPGADDRCATYTRVPAASAAGPPAPAAPRPRHRRPCRAVLDHRRATLGQRPPAQNLDGPAVLAVHGDQSAVAGAPEHVEHHAVVDLQQLRVGGRA